MRDFTHTYIFSRTNPKISQTTHPDHAKYTESGEMFEVGKHMVEVCISKSPKEAEKEIISILFSGLAFMHRI